MDNKINDKDTLRYKATHFASVKEAEKFYSPYCYDVKKAVAQLIKYKRIYIDQ